MCIWDPCSLKELCSFSAVLLLLNIVIMILTHYLLLNYGFYIVRPRKFMSACCVISTIMLEWNRSLVFFFTHYPRKILKVFARYKADKTSKFTRCTLPRCRHVKLKNLHCYKVCKVKRLKIYNITKLAKLQDFQVYKLACPQDLQPCQVYKNR